MLYAPLLLGIHSIIVVSCINWLGTITDMTAWVTEMEQSVNECVSAETADIAPILFLITTVTMHLFFQKELFHYILFGI